MTYRRVSVRPYLFILHKMKCGSDDLACIKCIRYVIIVDILGKKEWSSFGGNVYRVCSCPSPSPS